MNVASGRALVTRTWNVTSSVSFGESVMSPPGRRWRTSRPFCRTTFLPSDAPFGPGSVRARSDGSSPEPAYVVKGKIATKVFYTPGGAYYTRTCADVWFRTADDARAAGFTERAPRRHR